MNSESHRRPDWLKNIPFHPVIELPKSVYIHDFSQGEDPNPTGSPYSIGRYNENRENMYTQERFQEPKRTIHMGIDIAAPIHHPVRSFYEGTLYSFANNDDSGNYGPTLIVEHLINGHSLYALYGHLSLNSLADKAIGQKIAAGEIIGWIGEETVNGGWFPHLHFQLALTAPQSSDMPGVVSKEEHLDALNNYPDPQWVLGPLY